MTRDEYETLYEKRTGFNPEQLHQSFGLEIVPCFCGRTGCLGWTIKRENERHEDRELE